jgi:signal transduction histidine kinase
MDMLGGKISYHRDPTRGACFSARLPRRTPEPSPPVGD